MNCKLFQTLVWKKGGKGETRLKEVRIFTISTVLSATSMLTENYVTLCGVEKVLGTVSWVKFEPSGRLFWNSVARICLE